ncbi:MAG: hypothetical protein UY85_C0072G0010 [Candidatus Peribacteria bacterium GW2011_GWB1_54_5]|nr:MAG: hypothetical protein UY85_C0072G0010 [Candidatus Peribacteria bacterium GW2011_GWB1_54_5]
MTSDCCVLFLLFAVCSCGPKPSARLRTVVLHFLPLSPVHTDEEPLGDALTALHRHWLLRNILHLNEDFILRSVVVLVIMTAPRSLIQLRSAWRWNRTALLTDWRRPWIRPWVKRRLRQWLQ